MDRRNMLSTIQSVLFASYTLALPFWTYGYVSATLSLARKEPATPATLLEGFRRFAPVLRLNLLEASLVLGIGFVSTQIGPLLFCLTPWARPMLEQIAQQLPQVSTDVGSMDTMLQIMENAPKIPLYAFIGLIALALGAPVFYRFRLARLFLMDDPQMGAFRSLVESTRRMRGNYLSMLKLDLHFWWFHGLNLLTLALSSGNILLTEAGVTLNWTFAPLVFSLIGSLCQLALYWWRYNEVHVTYVHAYDELGKPPIYSE
jgi:uncharacterized membrane protein